MAGASGLLLAPVAEAGYMYAMANPEAAPGCTIGLVDANMPTNIYEDVGYLVNKYIVTPVIGD